MKLKWDWKRIWCHGWGIIKHGWVIDFSKVDAKVSNKTRGWVPRKGDSRGRAQESWMGATKPWMISARERIHELKKKKKKKKTTTNPAQKSRATRKHQEPRKTEWQGLPWCPVAATAGSKEAGVIPGQGTRSHRPQLRVCMPQQRPSTAK